LGVQNGGGGKGGGKIVLFRAGTRHPSSGKKKKVNLFNSPKRVSVVEVAGGET